jgi:hypothetical protein
LLGSRVEAALRSAGHEVSLASTLPAETTAAAIVCDLDAVDPLAAAELGPPVLGFYSHVDLDARRRAEAAGLAVVVPRSRMSRELPGLVGRMLASR